MELHLTGRRALVVGGSRGIGRAIARQLLLEGADVSLAARSAEGLARAARTLTQEVGRDVFTVVMDTGDEVAVRRGVSAAVEAMGGLDILINAAAQPVGAVPPGLADISDSLFHDDLNVKVLGYLRTAREAAPHMIAGGWGRIINISGLNARATGSLIGSVRNVAVAAMTKNLADELGPYGINVIVVHPGATRTEATSTLIEARAQAAGVDIAEMEALFARGISIGRIIEPEEVADVVAFLASPRSAAITGDAVAVGGGAKGAIHY